MAATLDTLTSAAQDEARLLGLQNVLERLQEGQDFEAWFEAVEGNFRALAVAECRAILERYLGQDSGVLSRFRECNAIYCFDPRIEAACLAHLPLQEGLLARRVELFLAHLLQFRVGGHEEVAEAAAPLENSFFEFRGQLPSGDFSFAQLNTRIKGDPDRANRQAAWDAFVPLGERNKARYKALYSARNRLAQELGHRDYMAMRLQQSEIDEDWLLAILDQLEAETQAPYEAACEEIRQSLGVSRLEPWDIHYGVEMISPLLPDTFDQESASDRLRTLLMGWGFTESEFEIPLHYAENFTMGGMCFGVDPGKEVAILLSPVSGPRYYRSFFHEYGHAMHFRHAGQNNILLNEEDPAFNEGMAVFFESFVSDPEWVTRNLPVDDASALAYCKQARFATLTWMRTLLVNIRFEHALYTRPDLDADAYYRELQARCGGFEFSEAAGARWAADQMGVSLPVYWHTYLFGELVARQTREALLAEDGHLLGNPKVGPFLKERYYGPGSSIPWPEKIRRATGRPLDGEAFFRYLRQA